MIKKVRYNLTRKISGPILTTLASRNDARLSSAFLALHEECLQREQEGVSGQGVRLLILPKAGFTEDAMACFGGREGYEVWALDRILIKAVFRGFLPEKIDDNNYRSTDPDIERRKKDLRSFWTAVLRRLLKRRKVDAVLSGNFSYAAEQEFAGALTQLGIPFVALHKECLKTPGLEPFYRDVYRTRKNPFQGEKICVYNEIERRIQEESGIASSEEIVVTGMPRLDRIHRAREGGKAGADSKKQVLFFAFNEKTGLPIIGRKTTERFEKLEGVLDALNFERLTEATFKAMVELAGKFPEIHVKIKTKGDVQSFKTLNRFLGEGFVPPRNLEIVSGGDPLDLLMESRVVCGFNSTALFEAVALNKPVVVPRFCEARDERLSPYLVDFEDAVEYANSPSEMIQTLKEKAFSASREETHIQLYERSRRLLTKWLGNPDGEAGGRVRDVVNQIVKPGHGR